MSVVRVEWHWPLFLSLDLPPAERLQAAHVEIIAKHLTVIEQANILGKLFYFNDSDK